ncbi:MAG: AEC family transporter [Desulfovibrio sp.]|nr:AEC family transporter [Desulfovibrio sp.]
MSVFFQALQSMFSLTLLCCIGYMVARKGWVQAETEIFLPRLLTTVVLPPFLMGNVVSHFQREALAHLIWGSLLPLVSIVVSFLVFLCLAWLCRVDATHRRVFATAACTSNTMFIGIPVGTALFGESAIVYVLLYFFGNTVFFWTIGNYCIACEGQTNRTRPDVREIVRRIFSPPLCGMLAGLAIVFMGIPLPGFVSDTCRYLGNLATPLALLYIGMMLHHVDCKNQPLGKDMLLALTLRLVVSPCILVTISWMIPLQEMQKQVFVILAGLPCMANIAIVSAWHGADKTFASAFVAVSTIVAMLTIPVWMTVLAHLA